MADGSQNLAQTLAQAYVMRNMREDLQEPGSQNDGDGGGDDGDQNEDQGTTQSAGGRFESEPSGSDSSSIRMDDDGVAQAYRLDQTRHLDM